MIYLCCASEVYCSAIHIPQKTWLMVSVIGYDLCWKEKSPQSMKKKHFFPPWELPDPNRIIHVIQGLLQHVSQMKKW